MRAYQKFRSQQDGNILIELAIILPVMVTLLIGMLDIGIVLNDYLRLTDSVRSAAEVATVRPYNARYDLVQLAGVNDANLNNYTLVSSTYCLCGPGSAQFSCGSGSTNYQYCGSYGTPNQYIKVTASASIPLIFNLRGLPASINAQATAIARIPWVGSGS